MLNPEQQMTPLDAPILTKEPLNLIGGHVIEEITEDDGSVRHKNATSCLNCVFASVYDYQQRGCNLGRLERFEKNTTVELIKESLGELEYSFYIVGGRFCNTYRDVNSDWAKNFKPEEYKDIALKEIRINLTMIVYVNNLATDKTIQDTIDSILAQTYKPAEIIILNNGYAKPLLPLADKIEAAGIKSRISRNYLDGAGKDVCFDMNMHFIKGKFYALCDDGYVFNKEFVEQLDNSLSIRLDEWSCLESDVVIVGQTKITQVLHGFREIKPEKHDKFIWGIPAKMKYYNKDFVKKLEDYVTL